MMELLLKDLCGRVPYNVKGAVYGEGVYTVNSVSSNGFVSLSDYIPQGMCEIENFKPYLFPMSSMTGEQKNNLQVAVFQVDEEDELDTNTFLLVDWCNKNHFDYRGLIDNGLAIDCTNLNIY